MNPDRRLRLGVLTSHPIQYQAPLFRALNGFCELDVFFSYRGVPEDQAEAGFGIPFQWDLDLVDGYRSRFLDNVSPNPSLVRFNGCSTPGVGQAIASGGYDAFIVYGWHFKSYLQAVYACRRLGVPVFARTDSHLLLQTARSVRVVKKLIYPWFLKCFDAFLAAGVRSSDYLRHYGVPDSRIGTVPYCVDTNHFLRSVTQRAELRTKFGIKSDSVVILFVGKFIPSKCPEDILLAAEVLRKDRVDCHVLFVGTGELQNKLENLSRRLAIPTTFAGFVNQLILPSYYSASDILVLPSISESWGMVVNEAFACGVPAVVSNLVGCAPDLINDRTGSIHTPRSVESLADGIIKILSRKTSDGWDDSAFSGSFSISPVNAARALIRCVNTMLPMVRNRHKT